MRGQAAGAAARAVISVSGLGKTYGQGDAAVHALRGIDLKVTEGEYVAVMGPSGSGKSTLMHILGCLDVPTTGRYVLSGMDVADLDEGSLALLRGRRIGFVFQSFNLIPRMTALANVELPLAYAGISSRSRRVRARTALDAVGLADRADHQPNALSGGQQQRVAVARALVTSPALLLADEPTGNLDSQATAEILDLFDGISARGRTIVLITHEHDVAARVRRVVQLADGRVTDDRQVPPAGRRPADRAQPAGELAR